MGDKLGISARVSGIFREDVYQMILELKNK